MESEIDQWAVDAFAELSQLPGVLRVGMALPEGGGRRLLFTATERLSGDDLGWCHIDAYADVPLNDAIRSGATVAGALDELDPRYAEFVTSQREAGFGAVTAVPLAAGGRVLGGLVLYYAQHVQARQAEVLAERLAERLAGAQRPTALLVVPEPTVRPGSLVAVHDIPPDPAAVSGARRFLRSTLAGWSIDDEVTDDAVLCLSELVTNSLVHTRGGCHVQVELYDGVLTTRVDDTGADLDGLPAPAPDPLQVHGHGLQVVDALASRWGRAAEADRASVWFALDVATG